MEFVGSFIVILCGSAAAGGIARRRGLQWPASCRCAAGYGPVLGLGLSSLGYFFAASFHLSRSAAPALAAGMALILFFLQAKRPAVTSLESDVRHGGPGVRLATVLLLAPAALVMFRAHVLAIVRGWEGQWDASAMWNQRAAFLFKGYDQLPGVIGRIDAYLHPEYPLLLPAATAAGFSIAGRASTTSTCLVHLWVVVGLSCLTFFALRRGVSTSPLFAVVGTSLLLLTPTFLDNSLQQCADVFTGYLVLAAAVALESVRREGEIPEVLAGASLGFLAFVKNEGLVYAALLAAIFVFFSLKKRPVGRLIQIMGGAAPGAIALAVFRLSWVPNDEGRHFMSGVSGLVHWSRWRLPLHEFLGRIVPTTGEGWDWRFAWCFLLATLGVGTIWAGRRVRSHQGFMLLSVASMVVVWLSAYVLSPYEQAWHIRTSMSRIMVHGYPLLLVAAISSATSAFVYEDPVAATASGVGSSGPVPI